MLLELLPNSVVDLVVPEGAQSFGLKFISVLDDDLRLGEGSRDLTGRKDYI